MKRTTVEQLQAELPRGCILATLNDGGRDRIVIVWTGAGSMPREVLARFGTPHERRKFNRQYQG